MSLTANHGPLSSEAGGSLNFELEAPDLVLYLDPMPYRIRALFEGETIVDAYEPLLLHESGRLPVYYFREEEVNRDLLESSETRSEPKGIAEYWTVRVGERAAPDAALSYSLPIEGAALLQGLLTLDWDEMDEWFCEDEQLFGHPRDPFSRIDTYKTSRHLRISLDGELLAETRRATALYETGLPPRYYIPEEDVRTELLIQSSNRSRCAYKGAAHTRDRRATGRCRSAGASSRTSSGRTAIPSTTRRRCETCSASSTSGSTSKSKARRPSAPSRNGRARTSRVETARSPLRGLTGAKRTS